MKIILKYLSICIVVLIFASCGGGGSSSSIGGTDDNTEIISCFNSSNIEEYTSLQSDDEIKRLENYYDTLDLEKKEFV